MPLPPFLAPMLATLVDAPFDSERHLFEIKWDGIRALAFVEDGAVRLLSRNRQDLTVAYPELAGLARLPSGTILDGELVVLEADGRPSFSRSLERVHAKNPRRAAALARAAPVQYVLFDLPHLAGASLCKRVLPERRERLGELVAEAADPRLVFSDGLVGPGLAFFDQVRERGLEGLVAKELDSLYFPGKRTRAWLKVKTTRSVPCAIVGWTADERGDLASLIVALEEGGKLVCVGRVGSGLTDALRSRLREVCTERARPEPFVATEEDGAWVEPGLFCTVSYLERTRNGLRAPVFVELLEQG